MAGIAVDHAQGSAVTDVDGNTFLDFIGGIAVGALGHSHPRWVNAVRSRRRRRPWARSRVEARVELLSRIAAHAPAPGLCRTQLYSSGAEAVESALRLAKSHTGKHELVSFWGGFHGKTAGALSLMGSTFKHQLGPMAPGSHLIPYADCYRCPLGTSYPGCGIACAELGRKQLEAASAGSVAAVIVEPMQGTAGNVIPPPEFLPAVRDIARELDALFIADEMITGLGRTGRWWGVGHSGVASGHRHGGQGFRRRLPAERRHHKRHDWPRRALEPALGLVLQLRWQPAGSRRRRRFAGNHRIRRPGRQRPPRGRGDVGRAVRLRRPLSFCRPCLGGGADAADGARTRKEHAGAAPAPGHGADLQRMREARPAVHGLFAELPPAARLDPGRSDCK